MPEGSYRPGGLWIEVLAQAVPEGWASSLAALVERAAAPVPDRLVPSTVRRWAGTDWEGPALVLAALSILDVPVLSTVGAGTQDRGLLFHPIWLLVPLGLFLALLIQLQLKESMTATIERFLQGPRLAKAVPIATAIEPARWFLVAALMGTFLAPPANLEVFLGREGLIPGMGKLAIYTVGYFPLLADLFLLIVGGLVVIPLWIGPGDLTPAPMEPGGFEEVPQLANLMRESMTFYFLGLAWYLLTVLAPILLPVSILRGHSFPTPIHPLMAGALVGLGVLLWLAAVTRGSHVMESAKRTQIRRLREREASDGGSLEALRREVRIVHLRALPDHPVTSRDHWKVIIAALVPLVIQFGGGVLGG